LKASITIALHCFEVESKMIHDYVLARTIRGFLVVYCMFLCEALPSLLELSCPNPSLLHGGSTGGVLAPAAPSAAYPGPKHCLMVF
jgi:hypothetical protein